MLLAVHIVFTWYFVPKSIQEVQIILRYCSFQKAFFFSLSEIPLPASLDLVSGDPDTPQFIVSTQRNNE